MHVNFSTIYGTTVPATYTWDSGVPTFSVTNSPNSKGIVKGYAPGTEVYFNNNTTTTVSPFTTAVSVLYTWDFGDFYNHKNNFYTLSCDASVTHVYIMPGTYSVTLYVTETFQVYNPVTTNIDIKTVTESITKTVCTIQEIPPVAGMYNTTTSYGEVPLTVSFTARTSLPGSFPIDKILWDFGDGSPLLTVSRYATATNDMLNYNGVYSADPADPRNYDPTHTYYRVNNEYSAFYASITAYSSSTGTVDTCSLTVGPFDLPSIETKNFYFLKNKHTTDGTLYALQVENNATFITSQEEEIESAPLPTVPPNLIRNTSGQTISYTGNIGSNFYTAPNIYCDIVCPPYLDCPGNLIKNGQFECDSAAVPPNTTGGTAYYWTLSNVNVHAMNATYNLGQPEENVFLDLVDTGSVTGRAAQTVPTEPYKSYNLSFDLGADLQNGNSLSGRTVKVGLNDGVNPEVIYTYNLTASKVVQTSADFGWQRYEINYTPASTTTTIAFSGTTELPSWGPVLDNVCFL